MAEPVDWFRVAIGRFDWFICLLPWFPADRFCMFVDVLPEMFVL